MTISLGSLLRDPCRPADVSRRWTECLTGLILGLLLTICIPVASEAQISWSGSPEQDGANLQWFLGTYLPTSDLGSFGRYDVEMRPWIVLGLSGRTGTARDRLRVRFEMAVSPNAIMRRSSSGCPECTPESLRLSVASWRFLGELELSSSFRTRTYLVAGPFMRVQLSGAAPCPRSAGDECALAEFARPRVDPGLTLGAGWEPGWSWVEAVQLTGHLSYYGRSRLPEASAVSWLPAVELSAFFPLDF